jgi:hypothetical protein
MSEGKGPGLWIALGCGAVLLVGMCVVAVAAGFFVYGRQASSAAEPWDRSPLLPIDPVPAGPIALEPPPPLVIAPVPVMDRTPRQIRATVTRAEGASGVTVGQTCAFAVTIEDRENGYWCRALAECGGVSLYGVNRPDGTGNGYFPCAAADNPRGVAGEDREMTAVDSDGFFHIDTGARRLVVMDDANSAMIPGAYRVEATIDSVQ